MSATSHTEVSEELVNGRPVGQLDWQLHDLIHEKIATEGFQQAQEFIALCLNDFNDRLARRNHQ